MERDDIPKATCSIDGCEAPARTRGWCTQHYQRWQRWGDPLTITVGSREGICVVSGCARPIEARGYCKMHYSRYWRYGDPHEKRKTGVPARPATTCAVDGCQLAVYKREWCNAHYIRWRKHGDPLGGEPPRYAPINGQRRCRKCLRELPLGAFEWRADRDAPRAQCRECRAPIRRQHAKIHVPLRRARKKGATDVGRVDREVVFERDRGICGICGEAVDPSRFHIDHIVPLSKGGSHSYANVQVAHPHCNQVKYAKLPARFANAAEIVAGDEARDLQQLGDESPFP